MSVTREFLKNLGIEGDNLESIMAEVGKSHSEASSLQQQIDDLTNQNDSLNSQLKERDGQLNEIKKSVGDNEELKTQIKALQDANKDTTTKYQEQLAQQSKEFKIETALRDAKSKNPKAVKALLDLDKVSVDGDNLIGLEDQLVGLKESDAYLFEEDEPSQNGDQTKPGIHATAKGNPSGGKPDPVDLSKMNYQQMLNLKQSDPTAFDAAKAETVSQ